MIGRAPVEHAWLGLAWDRAGTRLFSAGAAENTVHEFAWADGALKDGRRDRPGSARAPQPPASCSNAGFIGGLAIAADGTRLYADHVFGQAVSSIDLQARREIHKAALEAEPYTCVLSPDGKTLFVSLWGGAKVLMFAAETLAPVGEVAVGGHPNSMLLSKDGTRLFVACANTNAVWVIDLAARAAVEQISVALYPDSPVGTTPNSLALSPDGTTMLVANADNNNVAVVDIRSPARAVSRDGSRSAGIRRRCCYSADGGRVFVLDGKGLTSDRQPSWTSARRRSRRGSVHRQHDARRTVDRGGAGRGGTPGDDRRVYELSPYTRRAA